MDFKRSYPKLADYLSNRVDFSVKNNSSPIGIGSH